MKNQTVRLYGREFLVFSNLTVTQEVIGDMMRYAARSRMKYRRRLWWFFLTKHPICWQIEEMLLFAVNNNKQYGGLSLGLVEAAEWRQYREKIKEAYSEDRIDMYYGIYSNGTFRTGNMHCVGA